MKKELVIVAVITLIFIASAGIASAQFLGYNVSFEDLAKSDFVNAALLFLLIFSVSLFVLKDVFRSSYGAAVIVAIVVGAIGSIAATSFYGPIIPLLAPWMIVIALAVIALILWRFLKGFRGIIWVLAIIALIWFFVTRRKVCGIGALMSPDACVIIDFLAISILIIAAFNIFYKMFIGWRAMPPAASVPRGARGPGWIARRREREIGGAPAAAVANERERFDLARRIGIRNLTTELSKLQREYNEGIQKAGRLHTEATRLGWTKAGIKKRIGETDAQHVRRARAASDAYKAWYRQYSRNIAIEKQMVAIKARIEHLRRQISR